MYNKLCGNFNRLSCINFCFYVFNFARYLGEGLEPSISKDRVEKPHEELENLEKKQGYFYHARLKDFSESK